jgi:hypothetical protein
LNYLKKYILKGIVAQGWKRSAPRNWKFFPSWEINLRDAIDNPM